MADFVYGNTRLRARKGSLLGPTTYDTLLGLDLDELLGALARTPYGPDVERALPRFSGTRRLHEAIRSHLARALNEMRSFYGGGARELVDLLLARWDLRNLLTLLRGQAARAPAEEVLASIVPVGEIDDASAREIARQREFAAAVQLVATWRLPTPAAAQALVSAWPEYERTGDLAALESALTAAHTERVGRALARAGDDAAPLREAVARELDARNLLTALRLREALVRDELDDAGEAESRAVLPGGRLARATLTAAIHATGREETLAAVARDESGGRWLEPLERWARGADLLELQDELEAAVTAGSVGLFHRGDPLGVAVPIAYAAAKEAEARNLRLVGEAAAGAADPAVARSRLFLP